jgi:hypothetical protein
MMRKASLGGEIELKVYSSRNTYNALHGNVTQTQTNEMMHNKPNVISNVEKKVSNLD